MNSHALGVLEFDRVLALVADRASSTSGAARVRSLTPSADRVWLDSEHRRVSAMRSLITGDDAWNPEPIPELSAPLARLRVEGTLWTGAELLAGGTLLRSARRTLESLRDPRRPAMAVAVLSTFAEAMFAARSEESALERAIDADGSVRDDASPTLRRVRRELRSAEGDLVKLLERFMARLEPNQQVSDMSVTLRNGRYVIPIKREARVVIGGIVHDTSATGATLFVEPPAAVEAGNRIRELEAEELREIDRILRELTELLRPLQPRMLGALEALIGLDSLYARARFAGEFACAPADLCPPAAGFAIVEGRHPLLLAQHGTVVPFDLQMEPGERTLLVSGPNTGGKTVLLKALGLMSAMMQTGIPAPVGAGSRIAVFDDVFADVGDEQSIQASLSTFSAHVKNLGEILQRATSDSLVLVDELGSGTDPVEGAALGGAILEDLTRRATMTLATTHLGDLKELAAEVPGVVNASLQFDAVALAPTYRLIKGVPGRSYGLSIARRLRLPEDVLARAEERLPTGERDVNSLIADLEARTKELAAREREAADVLAGAQERAARAAQRETELRNRERNLERRSREDARKYLLEARAEVERTIKSLKRTEGEALEEAARAARRVVEQRASEQGAALARMDEQDSRERARTQQRSRGRTQPDSREAPRPGDMVEISTLDNRAGRLLEVRDGNALVAVGALKMTVPLAALTRSRKQSPQGEINVPILGDLPDDYAPTEIDVRGMRIGEVDDAVMTAIDAAIRADLKFLRIIHGKGTGALRERVTEMLRKDTRIGGFRMGAWNEGGTGVTVVDL
jgi:DNA mismatch repair protein MutS2